MSKIEKPSPECHRELQVIGDQGAVKLPGSRHAPGGRGELRLGRLPAVLVAGDGGGETVGNVTWPQLCAQPGGSHGTGRRNGDMGDAREQGLSAPDSHQRRFSRVNLEGQSGHQHQD